MRKRKEMGLTFFKMDLQSSMLSERKDLSGVLNERGVCTEKGLGYLCEYIAAIRDVIGPGTPLAADHFGPLNVNDSIRYAKAFEPYQLSWAEDLLQIGERNQYPYLNWQAYKTISDATVTPVNTGEDIFGLEGGFKELLDHRAVDVIHPDIETSGGSARNQAHCRLCRTVRHPGGHAPCRFAHRRLRRLPLRRHFRQSVPGHGEPRAGYAVVAGPGHRRAQADHRQGLRESSGRPPRPRPGTQRCGHQRAPAPARLLRAHAACSTMSSFPASAPAVPGRISTKPASGAIV